jgi:hypothetical protein
LLAVMQVREALEVVGQHLHLCQTLINVLGPLRLCHKGRFECFPSYQSG